MKRIPVLFALMLGLAACSGSSPRNAGVSPDARSAALSYQTTGTDMSKVDAQYGSDTASIQDVATCQAIEGDYQAKMGQLVDDVSAASATMDESVSSAMGSSADMSCVAATMEAELARHAEAACTAPDIAADRAEAAQHAASMAGLIDHQYVRYEQMGAELGLMPATTDSTWTCTHNPDGTFTLGDHAWSPPQTATTPGSSPSVPTSTPSPTPTQWPMPSGVDPDTHDVTGTTSGTGTTTGTSTTGTNTTMTGTSTGTGTTMTGTSTGTGTTMTGTSTGTGTTMTGTSTGTGTSGGSSTSSSATPSIG